MAVKKIIEIDVDVLNAQGGIEGLKKSFDEAEQSTKSLKQQMMEAQKEVTELSEKFGATSKEAINAAKRASELKDKIGDAKALTDAFNPDAKFNSLSASLGGVANAFSAYQGALGLAGVESKDLEQQLLKVQSAMALAQGLQGLGEARDSFKQLKAVAIDAFKGIKTAIGSTGIGLLVVALGTIYAYWDDIKEAVNGVSEQQKKLNADSQKNVDQQNEKLKSIGAQDNILKLQGKTEKEILAIKIKQTDEAILATEINQKNQIQTNKLAVEGAKRNYELLKSFIDFVSIPQRYLYETASKSINNIIDLLNKIPGVNIKSKLDETLGDKASEYIAKLGFDPEKVKTEGDLTIKESKQTLTQLKNDRAGYRLAVNDIDNKANKDKEQILLDAHKKELDAINDQAKTIKDNLEKDEKTKLDKEIELKKKADEILKQIDAELAPEETPSQKLQREYEERLKILTDAGASTLSLDAKYITDKLALEKKLADDIKVIDDKKKADKEILKQQEIKAALDTFAIVSDILGKQSKVGKAFAVAQALINTYQGITAGVKLGYPAAIPAVISASVTGFKAVKDILKTNPQVSGGTPSASSGGAGGGGSESTAPQFNVVGNAGVNQIAQTMSKEQVPVQAYVVANAVTTQQALNRNIVNNASI